jgi:hypothetical protein
MIEDELSGYESESFDFHAIKWMAFFSLLGFLLLLIIFLITGGCVTAAKNTYNNAMATPTPTPTPEVITTTPTTEPTPIPAPTESEKDLMLRTNGYHMRDWVHWFRPDVIGINRSMDTRDMSTWVTVYGYKFMPSYHYYSISWARNFLVKPDKDMKFLFVFVNMYSDTDTRGYLFGQKSFSALVDDRTYYPDDLEFPERRIVELENIYSYDHVTDLSIRPYSYKITQDSPSGIYRYELQDTLLGGRSNAADGYIIFQVPITANTSNTRIGGSFANLAGNVWWKLE